MFFVQTYALRNKYVGNADTVNLQIDTKPQIYPQT